MSDFTITIKGIDELRARLDVDRLDTALASAVTKIGAAVEAAAKAIVPVRTGFLQRSIVSEPRGLTATVTAAADYASFVERRRPYMNPAAQQVVDTQAEGIIKAEVEAELNR